MDIATAIGIGRKVAKVAEKAKELYELDQKRRVRVNKDVVLGRFRDNITFPDGSVRSVPDFRCDDFAITDGVFTVFATGSREPFCDGSSLAPDRIGSWDTVKAAIGHDALYEYWEEVSKAWGWDPEDVRWLADAAFGRTLKAEAARQKSPVMRVAGGVFSDVYYRAVRAFGGVYHRAKKAAPLAAAALLLAQEGCSGIPDVFEPSDEQPDYTVVSAAWGIGAAAPAAPASDADGAPPFAASPENPPGSISAPEAEPPEAGGAEGGGWETPAPGGADGADGADFSLFDWCWGGFDGAKAAPVSGCRVGSLKVKGDGLSYKWEAGGCEKLGASSASDYSQTICALFCKIDGKWRGGKFDWISTSRRTRDLKNCAEGYGGWDRGAVGQADAFAFVIVSKDGRRRTNVAIQEGGAR